MTAPRTLFEKIWSDHVIVVSPQGEALLYVDFNLINEGQSFLAFDQLRIEGRQSRRPQQHLAVTDHYLPTINRERGTAGMPNAEIRRVVEMMDENARDFRLPHVGWFHRDQGIAHVIAPELGISQPGMLITCNDLHTATNGACGALAVPIGGGNQLRHVVATQTVWLKKPKTMRIVIDGKLPKAVTAKDIILSIIRDIGVGGATGYAVEYSGSAIRALSMEGRLTICNMSIEAGARIGVIGPDDTTYQFLAGRRFAPKGADWDKALAYWRTLPTDGEAKFDREISFDATSFAPMVSWGTSPEDFRRSTVSSLIRRASTTPTVGATSNARSTTCGSGRRLRLRKFRSIGCSSAPAPTAASRICAPRRLCSKAAARPFPAWSPRVRAR